MINVVDKQIGLALFQAKEFERAAPALTQARLAEPDDMQVLLALGTAYARLGQTDAAQIVFADLLKRHPDSPELHLLWGQGYASVSQLGQAEEELERRSG